MEGQEMRLENVAPKPTHAKKAKEIVTLMKNAEEILFVVVIIVAVNFPGIRRTVVKSQVSA